MNYKIIGNYINDLKFKISDPEVYFSLAQNISNYKINIDIKSNQIKEKLIEVKTSLSLLPENKNIKTLDALISISTIIEINKKVNNKTEIEKIILIEVPSKVYPDLRKIFINAFENSGFKDINIKEKVDFAKLYNLRKN
tara:strand:+ start:340 stop:756 length:417 start_codon:yes stop_codon:yes gene_type:complete